MLGWGTGGWGSGGWGAPSLVDSLTLLSAVPVRENCVRLTFNTILAFTDVRGLVDAADPKNYLFTPVDGTIGEDGLPPRAVSPMLVEQPRVPSVNGRAVDVWLDRRMSPYPAQYRAQCLRSIASNGAPLSTTPAIFFGVTWAPSTPEQATTPATDFANVGYEAATIPGSAQIIGVYPTTSQGDYATDQGIVSYKKRIFRRLTTRRGRFAHLPNYGVGVLDEIKRLARPATKQALAAQAEAQIKEEPETQQVQVTILADPRVPGLFRFRVKVRTSVFGVVNLDIPIETA
jgi:hypothetical protein